MIEFLPRTFFEVAGGVFCLAALIFSGISLFEKVRVHSLRVLAIFVVAALALFGNHISVYFAAVFIIATAVTELEFLQTLAAIIRGNKEYFTYKTGTMSAEEKLRLLKAELDQLGGGEKKPEKAANEDINEATLSSVDVPTKVGGDEGVVEDSSSTRERNDGVAEVRATYESIEKNALSHSNAVEEESIKLSPPSPPSKFSNVVINPPGHARSAMSNSKLQKILRIEAKALDYVESMYGLPIQRDVVLKSADHKLALDGVMKFPENSRQPDEIFEVKYLPRLTNISRLTDAVYKLPAKLVKYTSITKRVSTCQLVVVLSDDYALDQKQIDELNHAVHVTGISGYHILNESELESFSFWNK
ncbi:hypothetical protein AB7M29_002666 [Pseudomonas sp. F-14 TE3623]